MYSTANNLNSVNSVGQVAQANREDSVASVMARIWNLSDEIDTLASNLASGIVGQNMNAPEQSSDTPGYVATLQRLEARLVQSYRNLSSVAQCVNG